MLTSTEEKQLATLLEKAEWPLPEGVFHALMGITVSVPLELGVFNQSGEVLLIYRADQEFTGWHMPGTVLRDSEDVSTGLKRLGKGEVETYTTSPIPLGWMEFGREVHPSRHAICLLHVCFLRAPYPGKGSFFKPSKIPEDTLVSHKLILRTMLERARDAGLDLSGT